MNKVKRNTLGVDEFPLVEEAASRLTASNLLVDDQGGSFVEVCSRIRRLVDQHKCRLVVVDYLQLLSTGRRVESRHLEVAEMSRKFKELARRLNIPIVVVCQLNRAVESRQVKRPQQSDLRESGAIEQDADCIVLTYRESYYADEEKLRELQMNDKHNDAELIVAKNRHGETGTARMMFSGSCFSFRNKINI